MSVSPSLTLVQVPLARAGGSVGGLEAGHCPVSSQPPLAFPARSSISVSLGLPVLILSVLWLQLICGSSGCQEGFCAELGNPRHALHLQDLSLPTCERGSSAWLMDAQGCLQGPPCVPVSRGQGTLYKVASELT